MLERRGQNWQNVIAGLSGHNQHIERLWADPRVVSWRCLSVFQLNPVWVCVRGNFEWWIMNCYPPSLLSLIILYSLTLHISYELLLFLFTLSLIILYSLHISSNCCSPPLYSLSHYSILLPRCHAQTFCTSKLAFVAVFTSLYYNYFMSECLNIFALRA